MTTCPKCGFEQPEDQFCAKCGIMMQGFVPEAQSIIKRLVNSPALIGVIGALAFVAVIIFVANNQEKLSDTSVYPPATTGAGQENVVKAVPTSTPRAADNSHGAAPSPTQAKTKAEPGAGFIATKNAAAQANAIEGGGAGAGDAGAAVENENEEKSNEIPTRIEFALVNADILDRINHGTDKPLSLGRYSWAVVTRFKNFRDTLSREPNYRTQDTESKRLSMGQPTMFFKGGRHPKLADNIGIYVEITPQRATQKSSDFLIQLKRNLPDVSPSGEITLASSSITETVTLPAGAGLLMTGVLPARTMPAGEEDNLKISILKVLTMPEFQRGEEDLMLIIFPRSAE